jgi:hypothetical protein
MPDVLVRRDSTGGNAEVIQTIVFDAKTESLYLQGGHQRATMRKPNSTLLSGE